MKNPFKRTQTLDDVLASFVATDKRLAEFEEKAADRINELDEELNNVSQQLGRAVRMRMHINDLIVAAATSKVPTEGV